MIQIANRIATRIERGAYESYDSIGKYLPILCTCGIAIHIGYHIVNVSAGVLESTWFRYGAILLLVPLATSSAWKNLRVYQYIHLYYLLMVFVSFPFFSSYVLVHNLIESPDDIFSIATRQVQLGFALACTVILIPDPVLCILGALIAIFLGWAFCSGVTGSFDAQLLFDHFLVGSPLWVFATLVILYFGKNRKYLAEENSRTMTAIGSNIAHELRTPLLGIRTRVESIAESLPELVNSYTSTSPNSGMTIPPRKLQLLQEASADILEETVHANTLIDIFLANMSDQDLPSDSHSSFSAADAAEFAKEHFPYRSASERQAVTLIVGCDFSVDGARVLLVHTIYNLIKNALHYTSQQNGPSIEITISDRQISIQDNGIGISKRDVRNIFRRFYTTDPMRGSGVGLSFCKSAMDSLRGKISVHSTLGKGTTFTLTFKEPENL